MVITLSFCKSVMFLLAKRAAAKGSPYRLPRLPPGFVFPGPCSVVCGCRKRSNRKSASSLAHVSCCKPLRNAKVVLTSLSLLCPWKQKEKKRKDGEEVWKPTKFPGIVNLTSSNQTQTQATTYLRAQLLNRSDLN